MADIKNNKTTNQSHYQVTSGILMYDKYITATHQ